MRSHPDLKCQTHAGLWVRQAALIAILVYFGSFWSLVLEACSNLEEGDCRMSAMRTTWTEQIDHLKLAEEVGRPGICAQLPVSRSLGFLGPWLSWTSSCPSNSFDAFGLRQRSCCEQRGISTIRTEMFKMSIKTGWWFGTFFIFPYIGNNHPN